MTTVMVVSQEMTMGCIDFVYDYDVAECIVQCPRRVNGCGARWGSDRDGKREAIDWKTQKRVGAADGIVVRTCVNSNYAACSVFTNSLSTFHPMGTPSKTQCKLQSLSLLGGGRKTMIILLYTTPQH